MALTGNEPINAANLRELSESGRLGGTVLFETDSKPNWNSSYGDRKDNAMSESVYGFVHIDVYFAAYRGDGVVRTCIASVPMKAANVTAATEDGSYGSTVEVNGIDSGNDTFGSTNIKIKNNGKTIYGYGIIKVIGYK